MVMVKPHFSNVRIIAVIFCCVCVEAGGFQFFFSEFYGFHYCLLLKTVFCIYSQKHLQSDVLETKFGQKKIRNFGSLKPILVIQEGQPYS